MRLLSYLWGWVVPPLFLCLLHSAVCRADSIKPFVKLDVFAYSEPVSISTALFDGYDGKFSKGERQWAWSWFEVGLRWRRAGISLVRRYDYNIRFSRDTAEFYGLTKNKRDLSVGREYIVNIKADVFHAEGVRVSYNDTFFSNRLTITTGLSYLQSDYFISGELRGKATALAENDYDYEATVNYQYTEDALFDRSVEETMGRGFSLDVEADLRIASSWSAKLRITDLVGRIHWRNLPFTNARAASDRKEYDDDGYVHIDPVLKGREGNHYRYTQVLSPRGMLNATYSYENYYNAFAEGHFQYDFFLWAVGWGVDTGLGSALIKYWPAHQAMTFGYKRHTFEIGVTADHFEIAKAKTFKLVIAYGAW